jgi:transposase
MQPFTELEPVPLRRPLSNPLTRGQLIVDLVTEELNQSELAEKYGVNKSSITRFKKRYQDIIDERQERLMDEYQDLWVAHKYNRLAARQVEVEELMAMETTPRTAEVVDKLLNSAADELGELQPKNQVNIEMATYELANIDIANI